MIPAPLELVKRTIHYYELDLEFNEDFYAVDDDHFREFFSIITKLAKTKDALRYQTFGERSIFIQDIKFLPEQKKIIGKLRCVRKDILPEIMNTTTDATKGIDVEDEEGIVETTHFVIDHSKKIKKIGIEFNLFGAKISDFINYCLIIGNHHGAVNLITYRPIVKDELDKFKERINGISEFYVKVHKDNIEQIEAMDDKLYTAMKASMSQYNPEYAELHLKFDYKQRPDIRAIKKTIFNLITKLNRRKEAVENFNVLRVKAEDSENNDKMELFDLLVNKVRSELSVQKKARYRTIITEDIIGKMQQEMIRKRI